jgi:hypothetical protein
VQLFTIQTQTGDAQLHGKRARRALYLSIYRVRARPHQRRSLSVDDGTVAGEGTTDPG